MISTTTSAILMTLLGQWNICGYLFKPISCTIVPYADHFCPIWTIVVCFTCFSTDTQILIISYSKKQQRLIYIICICGFSSVCIYSYFCLVNSWTSKYIYIFVLSTFGHSNLFRYLFGQFHDIRSSLLTYYHYYWQY